MKIWFTATLLKKINQILPEGETMTDFIITAVEDRLHKLERERNDRGRESKRIKI